MSRRVVITGIGILAPNAHGKEAYSHALQNGLSGIRHIEDLQDAKFGCQVAGVPQNIETLKHNYFSDEQLLALSDSMIFSGIAALDCWRDAGLEEPNDNVDWDTAAIIGVGISALDLVGKKLVPLTNEGKVRRLGSTMVEQIMASSSSAFVGGLLGLGNQVTTNSSACTTGTEAIVDGYYKILNGQAKRVIAGGTEGASKYIWAGFDAMRVLNRNHNDNPEKASRPMSESAAGFIPGSGCGLLMLEDLETAQARNAYIYGEIIGGHVNCGGQRNGGSITFPNPEGVTRCIQSTLDKSGISAKDIDLINGHLTATMADPHEINNWKNALGLSADQMPYINATKSLIGHGLGAAGGMESVACVLQLDNNFIHPSLNCEDLHPDLQSYQSSIATKKIDKELSVIAKASFGFGDVNGCVLFKKFN